MPVSGERRPHHNGLQIRRKNLRKTVTYLTKGRINMTPSVTMEPITDSVSRSCPTKIAAEWTARVT